MSITIDTEFSLGTAFAPGGGSPVADERVYCRVGDREWGVPHLLESFARHGIRATFFIETLHTAHFGDGPMGRVVERILAAGQDVQLHLHPQWLFFRQPRPAVLAPGFRPADNCEGRTLAELCGMIGHGIELFRRWGAPSPVALRTGALHVDRTVYRAMRAMGLKLASNVGWGVWEPSEPELRIAAGRHLVEGVLEVPVVTYRQRTLGLLRELRLCTITATSCREMRWLLRRAAAMRVSPFVILTHPFEFVRYSGGTAPTSRSRINLERLDDLCRLLAADRQRFRSVTFAEGAESWKQLPAQQFPPIGVPPLATLARIVENKLNDSRHRP